MRIFSYAGYQWLAFVRDSTRVDIEGMSSSSMSTDRAVKDDPISTPLRRKKNTGSEGASGPLVSLQNDFISLVMTVVDRVSSLEHSVINTKSA
ncbi:hypothetical protein EVAR_86119_1 [Eumeta japonica]|uniref:Uncharacterized protein n=1 Tax=Eumeta variegata TaxID=151549 RepID=A0A4C1V1X2_EUMVA|nr:hypothetical protein EVAR_86119_1 [Eumeta japonica]